MQQIKLLFAYLAKTIKYLTQNFKGILLAIFIIYLIMPSGKPLSPANVAQINLTGAIVDSQKIVEDIDDMAKDKAIKGVLFVVNSPGGSVAPSIEISYAIKRLALTKPVITYAQGSLASGSYYAAIWSHKIYANPGSLIGSIGVIFRGYNLEKIMKNLGISAQIVKAGQYKEAGTSNRQWTAKEHQELETVIKDTYELFIRDVAQARDLDVAKHHIYADAHIFSALRAKKVGLIDEVTSIHEAKLALQSLTKLETLIWKKPSVTERFLEKLSSQMVSTIDSYFLQPGLQ